jgi:hypothetical protein
VSNRTEKFLDGMTRSRLQAVWCGLHRDRVLPPGLTDAQLIAQTGTEKGAGRAIRAIGATLDPDDEPDPDSEPDDERDAEPCLCDCPECADGRCQDCSDPSCDEPNCDHGDEQSKKVTDDNDDEPSDDEDERDRTGRARASRPTSQYCYSPPGDDIQDEPDC